jgi:hypothetical protein
MRRKLELKEIEKWGESRGDNGIIEKMLEENKENGGIYFFISFVGKENDYRGFGGVVLYDENDVRIGGYFRKINSGIRYYFSGEYRKWKRS